MDALYNQVFFPQTFAELFSAWTRFPDAVPFAGGTGLIRCQGRTLLSLPGNILSLDKLEELQKITRTERYLEVGAMVKLSDIISLGKIVPKALTLALSGIAGPQLRNLATIGGNICHSGRRLDASAPLIALDARYELRTVSQIRWISASRFSSLPGALALNPQELLTRIRIPLEQWDYVLCKKLENRGNGSDTGAVIVLIARIQKNILTDIRVVFAGETVLRDKNSETFLFGKHLPLDKKEALSFLDLWKTFLAAQESPGEMIKERMLSFIESGIFALTD